MAMIISISELRSLLMYSIILFTIGEITRMIGINSIEIVVSCGIIINCYHFWDIHIKPHRWSQFFNYEDVRGRVISQVIVILSCAFFIYDMSDMNHFTGKYSTIERLRIIITFAVIIMFYTFLRVITTFTVFAITLIYFLIIIGGEEPLPEGLDNKITITIVVIEAFLITILFYSDLRPIFMPDL